jgi:hypothetical protein
MAVNSSSSSSIRLYGHQGHHASDQLYQDLYGPMAENVTFGPNASNSTWYFNLAGSNPAYVTVQYIPYCGK